MKYIMFWELAPEDSEKALEKNEKLRAESKKNPEKYMKNITVPYYILGDLPPLSEKVRGFTIMESDDHTKLAKFGEYFMPEFRVSFVPIEPSREEI